MVLSNRQVASSLGVWSSKIRDLAQWSQCVIFCPGSFGLAQFLCLLRSLAVFVLILVSILWWPDCTSTCEKNCNSAEHFRRDSQQNIEKKTAGWRHHNIGGLFKTPLEIELMLEKSQIFTIKCGHFISKILHIHGSVARVFFRDCYWCWWLKWAEPVPQKKIKWSSLDMGVISHTSYLRLTR